MTESQHDGLRDDIRGLSTKIDILTQLVGGLSTEIAVINQRCALNSPILKDANDILRGDEGVGLIARVKTLEDARKEQKFYFKSVITAFVAAAVTAIINTIVLLVR